jgi:hypothetical protein
MFWNKQLKRGMEVQPFQLVLYLEKNLKFSVIFALLQMFGVLFFVFVFGKLKGQEC